MRIGIDARLWNESGVGRYTRNLVEQLDYFDNTNEYVLFVLEKDEKNIKQQISNSKFKTVTVNIRWHTFTEQLRFPLIINKENLDLMHFPYFSVPIFYNKPFVVTIHDLILHHFPTGQASTLPPPLYWIKLLVYRYIIKTTAKKAKKIITVSNATKNEIVDHLHINKNKIVVTYEGAELSHIKSVPTNNNVEINVRTPYFLYVGNSYPHKNLERLLEAFAGVHSQMPNVALVFVGKEDYFYKKLRQRIHDLHLEKSVVFCGEVSDHELQTLYHNATALIMPSLMEGFGLPALEAMGNNCLVICSDLPVFHEICGDAAIYFDPTNTKDLENILLHTYQSRDTYEKRKKEGLVLAKHFSWEQMAKETRSIYESCIRI